MIDTDAQESEERDPGVPPRRPDLTSYQAEHGLLRQEMNTYFDQIQRLETWSLTAIFVAYGWFVSSGGETFMTDSVFAFALFAPAAMALFVWKRIHAFGTRIARLGYYIAYLDRRMGMTDGGWEHFVWAERGKPFAGNSTMADFLKQYQDTNRKPQFGKHFTSIARTWDAIFAVCTLFSFALFCRSVDLYGWWDRILKYLLCSPPY